MRNLILAACLMATPLAAQSPQCGPREEVETFLRDKFGETRQSRAMTPSGALMEVWASLTTGTWTVTVTAPTGSTCIAMSGDYFARLDEPEGDPA